MTKRVDQKISINFWFKLHLQKLQMVKKAFGDDSVSEAQIKLWYQHFKDSRNTVESGSHSGRPTARVPENVECMWAAINESRRLTVRELEDLVISRTAIAQAVMEDLGVVCMAAKFIPRLLSREQKEFCAEVTRDLLETANNDPDFLKKDIARDEQEVYGYDPKTKALSSQWKSPVSPRPKKAGPSLSNMKIMLMSFFFH